MIEKLRVPEVLGRVVVEDVKKAGSDDIILPRNTLIDEKLAELPRRARCR